MYELISSRKDDKTRTIYHKVKTALGEIDLAYSGIRAGLTWPMASSSGYFAIVGRSEYPNSANEHRLDVLAEGESSRLTDLFKSVAASSAKMQCGRILADRSEKFGPYLAEFDRYCRDNELSLHISDSPWSAPEHFEFGLFRIKEKLSKNALEIHNCPILKGQLGRISETDLQSERPEIQFYAIDALRLVLESFTHSGADSGKATLQEHKEFKAKHSRYGGYLGLYLGNQQRTRW